MDTLILNEKYKKALLGQVFPTKHYGDVRVLSYFNNKRMMIEFINTGTYCSTSLSQIRKGEIVDPFALSRTKLILNKAVRGYGKYRKTTHKDAYDVWFSMISRCYDSKFHKTNPSYQECKVCEDWLNFQNFAQWFYLQPKLIGFCLDKDIIIKGNKLYSPETCAFVPKEINNIFEKRKSARGDLPIGVYFSKISKKNPYIARCSIGATKAQHLGCHYSPENAFRAYKTFKEKRIKELAEQYKGKIDPRIYDAMMNYQVEITD